MTFGEFEPCMEALKVITENLKQPAYGVLGNHDSIKMVPELESQGINMLLNESVILEREQQQIALAGIDDAHYFQVSNLEKAADNIPENMISILLSHTPEIYRQASHAKRCWSHSCRAMPRKGKAI